MKPVLAPYRGCAKSTIEKPDYTLVRSEHDVFEDKDKNNGRNDQKYDRYFAVYERIVNSERARIAPEIIRLTDELLK